MSTHVTPIGRAVGPAFVVAKVSSIHVNGWFGQYDKLSMTRRFARDIAGLDNDNNNDNIVFVGDSPNDAPMVAFFRNACGVSGMRNFIDRMEAEPAYVTEGEIAALGRWMGSRQAPEIAVCA